MLPTVAGHPKICAYLGAVAAGVMWPDRLLLNRSIKRKVDYMRAKISGGLVHDLPLDLTDALTKKEGVVILWENLSPIARNEFICWIEDAKKEQTRLKRINRTIEELQEGKKRPCCWPGCIHRTDKKPGKWQQDVMIDKKSKKL